MSQDFGGGRWIGGRKDHRCNACWALIPRAEVHYQYKGMYDNEWQNWRMHAECYEAWDADGCEEFMPGDFPTPQRIIAIVDNRKAAKEQG